MISFKELGRWGRFGNQLFEYAFLRSTARRLGVQFYCPPWIGDELFDLDDAAERAPAPVGITKQFRLTVKDSGFVESALEIEDGTDIAGYFQSDRYYDDKDEVRRWFKFNQEVTKTADAYPSIDFSNSVSLSVRMGDYNELRYMFPLPTIAYYRKALEKVCAKKHILVFSDDPDLARDYLRGVDDSRMKFIEGPNDFEQFYLITRCRDNILANSSYSWWGAWLSDQPDKTVVMPKGWYRSGHGKSGESLICDGWHVIRSDIPVYDNRYVWLARRQFKWKMDRIRRLIAPLSRVFDS